MTVSGGTADRAPHRDGPVAGDAVEERRSRPSRLAPRRPPLAVAHDGTSAISALEADPGLPAWGGDAIALDEESIARSRARVSRTRFLARDQDDAPVSTTGRSSAGPDQDEMIRRAARSIAS